MVFPAVAILKPPLILPFVSGCALIAGQAGLAPNVIQMAQVADAAKTGADAVSYLETGRSLVDNAISKAVGKDCQMVRVLDGEYCIAHDDPPAD